MQSLFIHILNSGIIASYIILAVILIRLIFKKLPKRMLVLLWALVAIKLILPFSIESSFSLVPESDPIPQTIIATPAPDVNSNTDVQPIIPPTDFENNFAPSVPDNNVTVPDNNATVSQPNYTLIASILWLSGVGILLAYGAVSYVLLRRRLLGATKLKDNIRQHEKVQSPFILGFIKPKIYVPYNLDESTLEIVILHENAHIKFCDHLIKPFAFILLAVYWFNPLVWVSYILLCRDIEFACDERVIIKLPENARSNYAEALVKCGVNRLRISACPVAFGETGIKARVKNIMNYKKPAFWILITAVLLTIAITVCFLTVNPEDSADETPDDSPTPTVSATPSQTPLIPETHMTPDPSSTPKFDPDSISFDFNTQCDTRKFASYEEAYEQKVKEIGTDFAQIHSYIRYFYKDIDGNGIDELCVTDGRDVQITVYTFDNGYIKKVGREAFSRGSTRMFSSEIKDYPGIFIFYCGNSSDHYEYLTIKNNELACSKLWDLKYDETVDLYSEDKVVAFTSDKRIITESKYLRDTNKDIYEIEFSYKNVEEPFLSVLNNEQQFYYALKQKNIIMSTYLNSVWKYSTIDLDNDGTNELAVMLENGEILIFRNNGGNVVCFNFGIHAMYQINKDGTFNWNANAGSTYGCSKLKFIANTFEEVELWRVEHGENGEITFFVDDKPVSKQEFEEFSANFSTESIVWLS